MFPLSPISPQLPAYGLQPQSGVMAPDLEQGVQAPLPLGAPSESSPAKAAGQSFASILGQMVTEVNAKQAAAADAVSALQSGQNVSLHQAMISMEEANVSFQMMVEVRNRLLDSYQELMRLQV